VSNVRRGRISRKDRHTPEQILTTELRNYLSPNAQMVCCWLFSKIVLAGGRYTLANDAWLTRCSKVPIDQLPAARQALIDVGLIEFKHGIHPARTPDEVMHYYKWAAADEQN